jgi:hypothetical protein
MRCSARLYSPTVARRTQALTALLVESSPPESFSAARRLVSISRTAASRASISS